jgi:hypothetical protein
MSAKPVQAAVPLPVVTDLDAVDDSTWFDRHRDRRFRARRKDGCIVLVRRVKDVIFLRTIDGSIAAADTDIELAFRWFMAAYPRWSPEQIHKAARRALKRSARSPPE